MRAILQVKGLNKIYECGKNNRQQILKDIDFNIKKGEFVTIMGQSGSGKSTLLYNISGMDQATSGSVVFAGQELTTLSEQALSALRLSKMGFIFQQSNLLKNLTIKDNIMLASFLAKQESRECIQKRADSLMQNTGISELANNDITQASGGQLQRAAICRALMNTPEIVFADEPTGALNTSATLEVLDILADINDSGTTIMLVTHDSKVAARSERVVFMRDGEIVSEKRMGKYEKKKDDIKKREEEMASWLVEQGF